MDVLEKIPFSPNQAIIFDIDDTLIDSRTHRIIPKVFELYQYCKNRGYNIYIITARPRIPYGIQLTFYQLHTLGINGFKNIAFRPPLELDIPGYKLRARKAIQDTVIMSVGDKKWDIGEGGGYGILVKK
jgi:phosphoglycolate phosphatase-like HAD superfamily hydrolase|tara:strand:+ start:196 stop:582 length:387 start_codon:yes stop_codon:yes gene_type:complete